jgi:ABC-type branched-subunit amino acid transport system permease subunit
VVNPVNEHAPDRNRAEKASFANPLILLIVSLVIGAVFGYVSGQIATRLTKQAA